MFPSGNGGKRGLSVGCLFHGPTPGDPASWEQHEAAKPGPSSCPERHPHPWQALLNNRKLFLISSSRYRREQGSPGQHPGCSTRPHEKEESAWGGHLPQAGLGWAQYSGLDHRQDFDPFSPCYPATGAGRPDGPVFVKTFFSEAKLLKLNLLIHIISLCLIFQWIYCFKEYVVFICRCFMAWQQGQSMLKTNATRSYEIFCISTTNMYRVVCHIMPYW